MALRLCVAQWYVPLSMIAEREYVLHQGKVFLENGTDQSVRSLSGKVSNTRFESELFTDVEGNGWQRNDGVFVVVKEDDLLYQIPLFAIRA